VTRAPNDHETEHREAEFHDDWAESVDPASVDVAATWRGLGAPEVTWIHQHLGDLAGKRILDLGVGFGEASVRFAQEGARVTAVDISPRMLDLAGEVAARHGVTIEPVVASASDLSVFPDASFDVVYAANVLHHVDIERCVGEVHRVLGPGGRAAFFDPVQYNPVIQLYRRLAGENRTADEHPLRRSDLRLIRSRFRNIQARGFWLSALLIFMRFFVIDRLHPARHRYWRVVIERQEKHRRFLGSAHRFDGGVLKVLPPLRWLCWNLAVVAEK
jgi:SAM-dependent methyltransferase